MNDTTLSSMQSQFSKYRDSLNGVSDVRRVVTENGELSVAVQGDTMKPAIVTYHDLGLNCTYHSYQNKITILIVLIFGSHPFYYINVFIADATSFAGFFNYPSMKALLQNFCVYHVNAPGQEENAPSFPEE